MNKLDTPLISICIPTYNGENYIEETLNSALNQTYQNIEIVITDDHSSDQTVSICKSYAEKDHRIKVYSNKENLGLVNNWCESIDKASGQWIKFLFQDDILEEDCVTRMIHTALKHQVDFVVCNREYFFEEGFDPKIKRFYTEKLTKTETVFTSEKAYKPQESAQLIAPHIFNNCMGEPPTILFNKETYTNEDFPDNYMQLIDYIFILNNILKKPFVFIPDKLVRFRVHGSSESMRNNEVQTQDTKAFYKYLYVQYFERIQICHDILVNPIFIEVKKYVTKKHVTAIKNLYVMYSYKRHGFDNVFPFYEQSQLKDFIVNRMTSGYSYLRYKWCKIRYKKIKKRYKV